MALAILMVIAVIILGAALFTAWRETDAGNITTGLRDPTARTGTGKRGKKPPLDAT
jgi:hypothetical protein